MRGHHGRYYQKAIPVNELDLNLVHTTNDEDNGDDVDDINCAVDYVEDYKDCAKGLRAAAISVIIINMCNQHNPQNKSYLLKISGHHIIFKHLNKQQDEGYWLKSRSLMLSDITHVLSRSKRILLLTNPTMLLYL